MVISSCLTHLLTLLACFLGVPCFFWAGNLLVETVKSVKKLRMPKIKPIEVLVPVFGMASMVFFLSISFFTDEVKYKDTTIVKVEQCGKKSTINVACLCK